MKLRGLTSLGMEKEERPTVIFNDGGPDARLTEDVWDIILESAKDYNLTTREVLSKFLSFAAKVRKSEKLGDPSYAKNGDGFVKLSILGKREKTS